jgi:glycerophosphoryl diester phosphodiesterase
MLIISHRGYWKDAAEKNQMIAFERSFSMKCGVEADIRDHDGELVISHDIPDQDCIGAERLFELSRGFDKTLPLALNIKADGLQRKLKTLVERYNIENYFVFDVSVPDGLCYLQQGFKVFTRQSEYERVPVFYDQAAGVWLDEFCTHWSDGSVIADHINRGKEVCLVSAEIHSRDVQQQWQDYKAIERKMGGRGLMICTDCPEKAKEYFNE